MRAELCASLCAFVLLSGASAAHAATAQNQATATIQDSGGILVTQDLTFQAQLPSVLPTASLSSPSLATTTPTTASASGANVTVTGNLGDTVSLAVPQTFDVTRAGGPETYVVSTYGVPGSSVIGAPSINNVLGGVLRANGALSVDVSGRVAMAGRSAVPGAYRGLLVVIAQYN